MPQPPPFLFCTATGSRYLLWALLTTILVFGACISADDQGVNPPAEDAGLQDTSTDDTTDGDADADIDPCPVCCPGDMRCNNALEAVEVCDAQGQGFEVSTTCGSDEICEDAQCIDEPVCEPGEQKCEDSTSLATCRATGTGFTSESCPDGQACQSGQCVDGLPTGSQCETGDECAGGQCRCGNEEMCPLFDDGYCTTNCSTTSCNPGEICWQSDGVDAAGYDHCLSPCGSTCSLSDCIQVLAADEDGDHVWKNACLPEGVTAVGDTCDSGDECVSGTCFKELDFNFCTLLCETTGCPDSTACVRLEQDGAHRCLPTCQENADCPDGFGIDCNSEFTPQDNFESVCS